MGKVQKMAKLAWVMLVCVGHNLRAAWDETQVDLEVAREDLKSILRQ